MKILKTIGVIIVFGVIALLVYALIPVNPNQGKWVSHKIGDVFLNKAALLVPIYIQDRQCYMQLDTGAPNDLYWYKQEAEGRALVENTITILGVSKTIKVGDEIKELILSCGQNPIGTVGNRYFEHGMLSVDIDSGYLDFSISENLKANKDAQPMKYNGHPMAELHEGSAFLGYAVLDTGSASSEYLATNVKWWDFFTNSLPLEKSRHVSSYQVPAWGQMKTCFNTTTTKAVSVGAAPKKNISITFCPELGVDLTPAIGVIGLNYFAFGKLYFDYPNNLWLIDHN